MSTGSPKRIIKAGIFDQTQMLYSMDDSFIDSAESLVENYDEDYLN